METSSKQPPVKKREQVGAQVLYYSGWFLVITGVITAVLGAIALVTSGLFYPTGKDFLSAALSIVFGWGDYYYGKMIRDQDTRGLMGILLVQLAVVLAACAFAASGVTSTQNLTGSLLRAVVIMVAVYSGFYLIRSAEDNA